MRVELIELERYGIEFPILFWIVIVISGVYFIIKFYRTNTTLKDFIISHYEKGGIKVVFARKRQIIHIVFIFVVFMISLRSVLRYSRF